MHAMIRLLMLASLLATLSLASTDSANRIVPEVVEMQTGSTDRMYEFVSTTESTSTGLASGSAVAVGPTQEPTAEPTAVCTDLTVNGTEWHDSDSEEYTCDWYSDDGNCQAYGDSYEYDGYTANQACCCCGGGTSGATSEEMLLATKSETVDDSTYEFVSTTESTTAGSSSGSGVAPTPTPTPTAPVPTQEPTYAFDESDESSTGSASGSAAEPAPTPTPTPSPSPSAQCTDLMVNGSEWHDSYSSEYDCEWYSDDGNCQAYGDEYEYDGLTADEACCACGGGTTGGTSEGSGEELLVANQPADVVIEPSPHFQAMIQQAS